MDKVIDGKIDAALRDIDPNAKDIHDKAKAENIKETLKKDLVKAVFDPRFRNGSGVVNTPFMDVNGKP